MGKLIELKAHVKCLEIEMAGMRALFTRLGFKYDSSGYANDNQIHCVLHLDCRNPKLYKRKFTQIVWTR